MSTYEKNTVIGGLKIIFTTYHKLHKLLINNKYEASMTYINNGFTMFSHPDKRFCSKIAIFMYVFRIQNVEKLEKNN